VPRSPRLPACGSVSSMSEGMQSPVFVGRRDEIASLVTPPHGVQDGAPGVVPSAVADAVPAR
jgi:hypothetical protein